MSIQPHAGGKPLVPVPPPNWGELAPEGKTALVVRFQLEGSVVTIPFHEFKRWEHSRGLPEVLTLQTENEQVVAEGRELAEIRAALDLGRLCELRVNYSTKPGARPGPQVRRISIEAR